MDSQLAAIVEDTGTTLPNTLATIAGYIDTEIAAIKAVTDQFVFSSPGMVDVKVVSGGMTASGVRSAIGMVSANLDSQIGTLLTASSFAAALPSNFGDLAIEAVTGKVAAETESEFDYDEMADAVATRILPSANNFAGNGSTNISDTIRIKQRDDYTASIGRAFEWSITNSAVDYTAASVVVGAAGGGTEPDSPVLVGSLSLQNKAVGSCTVRLEFSSAQTNVPVDRYNFDAHLLIDGKRSTDIELQVVVEPKYADAPA
ncbi:hypothetical protein RMSM_02568 [Rhodopirellula maiorica SM1]|uniref:Uncharacterized protein n=1 Tax=Rhodopirellula maiorica SM1 TaxID=1265738 RepID=M5RMV4_9BACT|nr:hypothetical protein RMSM_02568 [Rhodopirellula maiorica SM1]